MLTCSWGQCWFITPSRDGTLADTMVLLVISTVVTWAAVPPSLSLHYPRTYQVLSLPPPPHTSLKELVEDSDVTGPKLSTGICFSWQ